MNGHWLQRTLGIATVVGVFAMLFGVHLPVSTAGSGEVPAGRHMRFGMDIASIGAQKAAGVGPDYAVFWVGPWVLEQGWNGVDANLERAHRAGVTPVVHFYYWGNDITRSCVLDGCQSTVHDAWKDQVGWDRLADGLVDSVRRTGAERPVVIVLETEFNKNDVRDWEHFDGVLAQKAGFFKASLSGAQVVLGLGNWGAWEWGVWDRAAGSSDYVGLQGMRASTKDTKASYYAVVDETISGAKQVQRLFGKPVFLTDIALSSWPFDDYATHQASVLRDFFSRMGALEDAGVESFVYRSFRNTPHYNPHEYYGKAEQGWGLASANGDWKPAMSVWVDGVRAERTGPLVRVEGEAFDHKDVGGRHWDRSASGGSAWNLWSDGGMRQDVSVPAAGHYAINVKAGASMMDGVGARMVVQVDGIRVLRTMVESDSYRSHWAGLDATGPGTHRIVVKFTNDDVGGGEDRNLHVDRLAVWRR